MMGNDIPFLVSWPLFLKTMSHSFYMVLVVMIPSILALFPTEPQWAGVLLDHGTDTWACGLARQWSQDGPWAANAVEGIAKAVVTMTCSAITVQ